jgi:transposase
VIGPALLAKFGDDPQRFPHPSLVQALAGTSPVTVRSGKHRIVRFRHACDKEWRFICQEWAMELVNQAKSPSASAYYAQIRPHCHSNEHAYRCVAHRWMAVAWKLWQTGQTYDETFHFQQRTLRTKPR